MSALNLFQISLELWAALLCMMVSLIQANESYNSSSIVRRIWSMLLINSLLLTSDILAYLFNGDMGKYALYIGESSNYLVFFFEGCLAYNFNQVVTGLVKPFEDEKKTQNYQRICLVLILAHVFGLIITPITHYVFSFNQSNQFVRGTGMYVQFVLLGIICLMNFHRIFLYRMQISRRIRIIFRSCMIGFVICYIAQIFSYGLSYINVSLTIGILALFFGLLEETKHQEVQKQIRLLEDKIEELMREKGE